jgi:hypothetical protein
MHAEAHTRAMLTWWAHIGVDHADLAVRRATGIMLWQRSVALPALPLAWARAENAQRADIYIRPARGHAWPLLFVDDVRVDRARRAAPDVDRLIVETSSAGGCHVWLRCDRALDEPDRRRAQRHWVMALDGDPGSVSGEHLGRLAGFKNWKRGGCWVNVIGSALGLGAWHAIDALSTPGPRARPARRRRERGDADTSPSGRDWAWVCTRLERGASPAAVYALLLNRARPRRGADAERYAHRTVERAARHVATHAPRAPQG